jgi:hypothetical protein
MSIDKNCAFVLSKLNCILIFKRWQYVEVTVNSPLDTWQAVFEGVRGAGDFGNIG